MLTRRVALCPLRCSTLSRKLQRRTTTWSQRRQQSSYAATGVPPYPTPTSFLAGLSTELDRIAPRIDIRADQVEVLVGPQEFYETLKSKIRNAKRRIFLSTLYIGKSEYELVFTIREALLNNGPDLRVSILTDAIRGTRESPEPSCASLLAPLVAEFPDRVEVRMYHTPNLTGLRKKIIPKRINEGWGLQHMKLYGIDNEVILSGANLSDDYFTNRQDRYHVFSSKRVTDYFACIHRAVCSLSFVLEHNTSAPSYSLTWPSTNPSASPLANPRAFTASLTTLLAPLIQPPSSSVPTARQTNTTLYPLLSLPPTLLNTELPALRTLLSSTFPPNSSYLFTAGYFNPHRFIIASLLSASSSPANAIQGTILNAHPHANGFHGSSGISGMLPAAYSHLSLRFLQAARRANAAVTLREWKQGTVGEAGGWTYHAKGLWISLPSSPSSPDDLNTSTDPPSPEQSKPCITIIGSSNYTKRSYALDLEVGAMVLTSDETLMAKWKREEQILLKPSREVGEKELEGKERRAGWKVRIAMWIVSVVGGAL